MSSRSRQPPLVRSLIVPFAPSRHSCPVPRPRVNEKTEWPRAWMYRQSPFCPLTILKLPFDVLQKAQVADSPEQAPSWAVLIDP